MATALTGEPPPDRKHAVSLMRIRHAQCRDGSVVAGSPARTAAITNINFIAGPAQAGAFRHGTDHQPRRRSRTMFRG
jgi:hypothetical protein